MIGHGSLNVLEHQWKQQSCIQNCHKDHHSIQYNLQHPQLKLSLTMYIVQGCNKTVTDDNGMMT